MATPQSRFITAASDANIPTSADVVIIGGGPAGTGAAWGIERAAPGTRVVVVEASEQLASGASTASLENFRTCWAATCLGQMMRRSVEVFLNADEYFGAGGREALGVKQQGYLYLGFNEQDAAALKKDVDILHAAGMSHIEYLNADEIGARYPWLKGRVYAGKYDPMAGWMDSNAMVYQLARGAAQTQFLLNAKNARILTSGGRVTGVQTSYGTISAPRVVIAAGAGARAIGRTAGIELPIIARPRQSFTTGWRHAEFPEDSPCIISAYPFPHVRPEAQTGAIFGWEYRLKPHLRHSQFDDDSYLDEPQDGLLEPVFPVDQLRDPRFPSMVLSLMAKQFGYAAGQGFGDSRYLRGVYHRAGYYVYRSHAYVTQADGTRRRYHSQRAIIDRAPEVDGLFLSIAHVGHGVMSAPGAGEILAAHVTGTALPHPSAADFGYGVDYVEHDAGGLGAG